MTRTFSGAMPVQIDAMISVINDALDGVRLVHFEAGTDGSAQSVDRYDDHGHISTEVVGSTREVWTFLRGFLVALDITNRL